MVVSGFEMYNGIVHTHKTIFQVTCIGRNFQGIESINICNRTYLRVINTDTHARQWVTGIIFHRSCNSTCASTRQFARHCYDVSLNVVSTVDSVHHFIKDLSHRTVLCFYRYLGEGFCKIGTVDKVQSRLFLHFRKELLHGHLRHVKCHGLILHRLRCHIECQHRHQQDNDHSLRCFDSFHSLTFLC